jgi:cystathionine beta-lyase
MDSIDAKRGFATRLTHTARPSVRTHGFVNVGVHRGSTVLQPSCQARVDNAARKHDRVMTYGTAGGPTQWALEDLVAEIEGGQHCTIVETGLAAVTAPLMSCLKAGDRCLMPDSVYGPARALAEGLLKGWNVETVFYDPTIGAEQLEALWTPNTKVLYLESPGSHTFEMQDVPALAAVAKRHGAIVMIDNTWGIHHFQPFTKGCDVSIQALTKYVGGHSDILLGSITTADRDLHLKIRNATFAMGHYASPDDAWLAIRGARTMALRLKEQEQAALDVARWLQARPEVLRVMHPALPQDPGHALWKRDFTGACSLFGIMLQTRYTQEDAFRLVDGLKVFGIGASWGGFESLALPTNPSITRTATSPTLPGQAIRLHIGLEAVPDLIADLEAGLDALPR